MRNREEARRQLIAGLRAVANFYESQPGAYYDGMTVTISMYVAGKRAQTVLPAMAVALAAVEGQSESGGSVICICKTICGSTQIVLSRSFSPKVQLEFFAPDPGRQPRSSYQGI